MELGGRNSGQLSHSTVGSDALSFSPGKWDKPVTALGAWAPYRRTREGQSSSLLC